MNSQAQSLSPVQTQNDAPSRAQIFTMPEAYRHGKEAKLVEPKIASKTPVVVTPSPPTSPLPPRPTLHSVKKSSSTSKALLIAGVLVVIALGVGGILLWRSAQPKSVALSPTVQTQSQTQTPPPAATEPSAPSAVEQPSAPATPQTPFITALVPGVDSDSDGLTDKEEDLLYGTNSRLPDTDADGFLDGNEVFHRYNPKGTAPGTLLEAGLIKVHVLSGIQLLYPTLWNTQPAPQAEALAFPEYVQASTQMRATTGESILGTVYDVSLPEGQQTFLLRWMETSGGQEQVVKSKTKGGYDLYVTRDQLNAFVILPNSIAVFQYQSGTSGKIEYTQTFQMMLNSVTGL